MGASPAALARSTGASQATDPEPAALAQAVGGFPRRLLGSASDGYRRRTHDKKNPEVAWVTAEAFVTGNDV